MRTATWLAIALAVQSVVGDFESDGESHGRLRGGSDERTWGFAPQRGYSFGDLPPSGDGRAPHRPGKVYSTSTPPTKQNAAPTATAPTTYTYDMDPHQEEVDAHEPTPTKQGVTLGDSSVAGRPVSKAATPAPATSDDSNPQQANVATPEPTSGTPLGDSDVAGHPVSQLPQPPPTEDDDDATDPQQSDIETLAPPPSAAKRKETPLGASDVVRHPIAKTASPPPDATSSAKQSVR